MLTHKQQSHYYEIHWFSQASSQFESIDTIEDYMARMNYIIECARIDRFDSIAEWELEIME